MKINQAFTILSNAGGIRAARIITDYYKKMSWFRVWCTARMLRRDVPVAKIIGQKWFYGLSFYTNMHTLDPRPDTETLVAAVISDCGASVHAPKILDLGTGTGCIIISLVKNIHDASGTAVDISRRALRVVRKNIETYGLGGRINTKRASFNEEINFADKFDMIVSNPPYIARGDSRVDAGAMHDPECALYASDDGFAAYDAIAKNARAWIKRGGKIYLEIGIGMGARVAEIFENYKWKFIRSECDLSGTERVLVFSK